MRKGLHDAEYGVNQLRELSETITELNGIKKAGLKLFAFRPVVLLVCIN